MPTKKKATAPATEVIKGFKVTDANMQCRRTQYALGTDYTLPSKPELCETGFHFCLIANNCFNYYSFEPTNRVFEVEAFGETVHGDDKSATNGIRFVRELTWPEVLVKVNLGANNTGRGNSGDRNSGDRNSGDRNSGDRNSGNRNSGNLNSGNLNSGDRNSGNLNSGNLNSGDRNSGNLNSGDRNSGNLNSGDRNSGYLNSGDRNSGDRNSGDRNSGNLNSGDRNSGYLNSGNRNTGIFCTTTPKNIELFNQPSEWSLQDFLDSEAYWIVQRLLLTEWRPWSEMSDHEKEQYPRAETSEGYTKHHDYKAAWATLWGQLDTREQAAITSLPNFDAAVFLSITGVAL
jgi:hypothetical protein